MASAICRSPSLCNLALLDVQVTGVEETNLGGKIQYAFCLDLQWSDYRRDVVWRNYYEFVELHNALLGVFKEYSKPRPGRQNLPTIPARQFFRRNDRKLAESRRPQIQQYVQQLIRLPQKVSQSSVVLSFFERRPSDPPPPCQCSEDFARKHMSRKLQNGVGTPEENGGISCSTSADSSPKKPRSRTMKDIDGQEMTSSTEGSPTKAKFKTSWESPEFQKFHRLSYTIAWDCADLMGEMEDLEDGETMWEEMELGS
ncbi:SH3 and PX domain-containing protein 2A-like [Branchiostoma floridae x Branchiostoma japonicum]